ncbi:unnamed protein product [Effrenium voratum]|nr:unnamed protein product [Effrenium voratum]
MAGGQPGLADWGYEDLKVIGRGQYGKAHLVRSGSDDQYFIAKTIDLTCLSSKEQETAFQEVALLRRLDHPNIVSYRDNFFMGDTLVIIMQYCEGGDLATYIKDMRKQRQRIDEQQIMHYFVQILQALQYIHGERILHRDLKTSNLFLMKSKFVVKLGDFGISRVLEGSIEAAITVVGTPYYMSPEVCENKPYTFKSDVWSLGCCLYEMCMLKHAFSADNLLGLVYKIVSDKYEPIPDQYTPQLNTLIQRMLEKNADHRPSVRDLLADPYVQSFVAEYLQSHRQSAASLRDPRRSGRDPAPPAATPPAATPPPPSPPSPPRSPGEAKGVHPSLPGPEPRRVRVRPGRQVRQQGGQGRAVETPKEAAARRKREAADREAERHKAAAKESLQNKTVARQMREAEFQTTLAGRMGASAPELPSPGGWPGAGGHAASAAGFHPPTHYESREELVEEEIEESDYSEEYEDDFEDEPYTDEDHTVASDIEEVYMAPGAGALSMVREEEDLSRVMNNYEQDLARHVPDSPAAPIVPRRTGSLDRSPAAPARAPATPTLAIPIMDLRSRMKEELIRKMGEEPFEKAFHFLLDARMRGVSESSVKKDLEALVGRQVYKQHCFDLDQLVYQARAS